MNTKSKLASKRNERKIKFEVNTPNILFEPSDDQIDILVSVMESNINSSLDDVSVFENINLNSFRFNEENIRTIFNKLNLNNPLDRLMIITEFLNRGSILSNNFLIETVFSIDISTEENTSDFVSVLKEFLSRHGYLSDDDTESKKDFYLNTVIAYMVKNLPNTKYESDRLVESVIQDKMADILLSLTDYIGRFEIPLEFIEKYINYMPAEILLNNYAKFSDDLKEKSRSMVLNLFEEIISERLGLTRDQLSALNIDISLDMNSFALFNELENREQSKNMYNISRFGYYK